MVGCFSCYAARDIITTGQNISDGSDYLESPEKKFQMGFFSREESSEVRRYVGVWYTMDPKTVVWVANRDKPVLDSTGVLAVSEEGSLKLFDGNRVEYFSTDTDGDSLKALKLEDTGNAVLIHCTSRITLWESFKTATDTLLPGMMMSSTVRTLTSWKSLEDPACGRFVFQLDPVTNRYCIFDSSLGHYSWKSGSMSKNSFDDNQIYPQALKFLYSTKKKQNISLLNRALPNYNGIEPYSRLVMNHTGHIQYFSWSNGSEHWVLDWQEPKDNCSRYGVCGLFGMCTQNKDSFTCSCLHGFEPTSPDEYKARDYKSGCKRTSEIICDRGTNDTFLNKTMISMDDTTLPFFKSENESECIKKCLENCTCLAYSFSSPNKGEILDLSRNATQGGCWFWDSAPNNLRANGLHTISFRVSKGSIIYSSSGKSKPETEKRLLAIVIVVTGLVISTFCGISYILFKILVNRSENNQGNIEVQSSDLRRRIGITELLDLDHSKEDDREGIDVPYFELESIMAATDDFSEKNRLGQGGFGPVYKGKLPGGKEIAVKRLSSLSGQGLQEFKNEVMLIAKLQHRNLVRLVGYCIVGEEKMLLYEYMPNRSLDKFIFDRTMCTSLGWEMRFDIIMGIARGLNYLHHDSRLRVIHRDLKTIQGKDLEATTGRVMGTFGYMSPEYALDGLFSIKSDVFSFGVVMLEIVSGKRNIGFYQSRRSISLLGHAWNLWKEDKPFELMDQILMESCNSSDVLKCIIVGLLCVQGDPDDRPNMTNIILMLSGDIVTLPSPKEPAFIPGRDYAISSSSSSSMTNTHSKNMLTITKLDGR
ncbi:unnamed protein product [Lactuca virosa]|uniref:Receptor-like serine/threonine-protein kinase n=1 Tax=Lactuca virosa TaxID=75947 RepID=A0AAU9N6L6_9ASTR|nr:unnamed protein product [Lactuca virosa]